MIDATTIDRMESTIISGTQTMLYQQAPDTEWIVFDCHGGRVKMFCDIEGWDRDYATRTINIRVKALKVARHRSHVDKRFNGYVKLDRDHSLKLTSLRVRFV